MKRSRPPPRHTGMADRIGVPVRALIWATSLLSLVAVTQPLPPLPHGASPSRTRIHPGVVARGADVPGGSAGGSEGEAWPGECDKGLWRDTYITERSARGLFKQGGGRGPAEATPGEAGSEWRHQLRLRGGYDITPRDMMERLSGGHATTHEADFDEQFHFAGHNGAKGRTGSVERDGRGDAKAAHRSQTPQSPGARLRIRVEDPEHTLRLHVVSLSGARTPSKGTEGAGRGEDAAVGQVEGVLGVGEGADTSVVGGGSSKEQDVGGGNVDKDEEGEPDVEMAASTSEQGDLHASVREFCLEGKVEEALELFRADLRNVSYPLCTNVMREFADAGRADCAQAAVLHMHMLCVENGGSLDAAVYNELMLAYARDEATASEDGLGQAFSVLDQMTRTDVKADITTYNRLMEACSSAAETVDAWDKGLRVLDLMGEAGVRPVIDTFNTLVEACGKCGWSKNTGNGLEKGAQILARMQEDGVNATTDTFNILMYGCAWAAGAGDGWSGVEQGLSFLEAMAECGSMPDVITFNNLIAACAQAAGSGDGARARDQAFRLLETMRKVGLSPDQGTCDTLIATCAKAAAAGDSEGVEFGLKVLDMMKRSGMTPDRAMHNALLGECVKVAESMHEDQARKGWAGVEWMSRALSLIQVDQVDDDHAQQIGKLVAICTNLVAELATELSSLARRHFHGGADTGGEPGSAAQMGGGDAAGRGTGAQAADSASAGEMKLPSWHLSSRMGRSMSSENVCIPQPSELFSKLQQLASMQLRDLRELRATSQSPTRGITDFDYAEALGEVVGPGDLDAHDVMEFSKMLTADDGPFDHTDHHTDHHTDQAIGNNPVLASDHHHHATSCPSSPSRSDGRRESTRSRHEVSEGEEAIRKLLKQMPQEGVCAWLAGQDLGDLVPYFKEAGVDGAGLLQLRDLLTKDIEVFYGTVERNLKISKFGRVLKLAGCLESFEVETQAPRPQ